MGARSRRKGHAWEREVAHMLAGAGRCRVVRRLDEPREGNAGDLECGPLPLSVQCRVGAAPSPWKALADAIEAAEPRKDLALAVVRRNGRNGAAPPEDMATMPLADFLELVRLLRSYGIW